MVVEISVITQSAITCPSCGRVAAETMPTDTCQFFYTCTGCGEILRPKPGDCCVYCSYGSVRCPSIQAQRAACAAVRNVRKPEASEVRWACVLGGFPDSLYQDTLATGKDGESLSRRPEHL